MSKGGRGLHHTVCQHALSISSLERIVFVNVSLIDKRRDTVDVSLLNQQKENDVIISSIPREPIQKLI